MPRISHSDPYPSVRNPSDSKVWFFQENRVVMALYSSARMHEAPFNNGVNLKILNRLSK
jgi:hypothetical protein